MGGMRAGQWDGKKEGVVGGCKEGR